MVKTISEIVLSLGLLRTVVCNSMSSRNASVEGSYASVFVQADTGRATRMIAKTAPIKNAAGARSAGAKVNRRLWRVTLAAFRSRRRMRRSSAPARRATAVSSSPRPMARVPS